MNQLEQDMNSSQWANWYLKENGKLSLFLSFLEKGHTRYGQAFFNALPEEDQKKIQHSVWDTFWSNDPFSCFLTIANVLTTDWERCPVVVADDGVLCGFHKGHNGDCYHYIDGA